MKRIVEVSCVRFDTEKNQTFYKISRYNLAEDGSKEVKGFSEGEYVVYGADGKTPKEGETLPLDVIAYVEGRIIPEEVDEIVISETQTITSTEANQIN